MENLYTPIQSESELIKLAIAKDTNAFNQLMEKYEQQIYRVARNITKNHEDAEDVTQSTFFKAYAKLNQFQGNSKFSTWLTRIAVNESLMCLRKHKQNNTVSIDENLETENGSMRFDFAENKPNGFFSFLPTCDFTFFFTQIILFISFDGVFDSFVYIRHSFCERGQSSVFKRGGRMFSQFHSNFIRFVCFFVIVSVLPFFVHSIN